MLSKLQLLCIAIASLQLSLCDVIRENHATDRPGRLHNFLLSIPNVEPEKVDMFIDLIKNTVTPNERQYISALELLLYSTNISKDQLAEEIDENVPLTDEELVKIERYLNIKLTSNEIQKIIKILRSFGPESTKEERFDAANETMVHAITNAFNIPANCISKQTLIDLKKRKINVFQDLEQNECLQSMQ